MKTWKQNLKHLTVKEYCFLKELCHLSKNIYNASIYNIRQNYFEHGTYLKYEANWQIQKAQNDYLRLGGGIAQQSIRAADQSFKSFFALLDNVKKGKYERWKVKLPSYLEKDSFYPVVFTDVNRAIKDGQFTIPVSRVLRNEVNFKVAITIPPYLRDKDIHQIHIVPKYKGTFFEVRYIFEDSNPLQIELDKSKFLAIDLGVNNLATCVDNSGRSFIIDGKKLKSINQQYNREIARLSSIKDKQGIKGHTTLQYKLAQKRNNRIDDYIYNTSKYIINYCIENKIKNIVLGYNDGFQQCTNLGCRNNQNFVNIPFGRLKSRIKYLAQTNEITLHLQEESYTSQSSFFDNDEIPVWNPLNIKKYKFSGKRIKRGLYQTRFDKLINADVNGALNILRKSKLTDLSVLQSRGYVMEPIRIRVS